MTFFMFVFTFLFSSSVFSSISPELILKKADDVRNPVKSFKMKIRVTSTSDEEAVFEVYTKGKDLTLVRSKRPKKNVGRNMLMIKENMWVFIPNLKRAVRVGLSQKLTGQTANGDISRMRFSGDYNVSINLEDNKKWILFLSAKKDKKGLTYSKIKFEVEKKSFRPIRAEYLSTLGKILKTATFSQYKNIAGKFRPTVIIITDNIKKNEKSVMTIESMKIRNISKSFFSKNNLK